MRKTKTSTDSFLDSKLFSFNNAIKIIKDFRRTAVCKENGHDWVFTLGKGYYRGDHNICKHCGKIEWIKEKEDKS